MIEISSSDDPRIQEFVSIRDHVLNNKNLIVTETEKIFLQYQKTNRPIYKVLATPNFIKKHNLTGDNVFSANKDVLEKIAGFKIYFEVLFLAEKPQDSNIEDLTEKIILLNGLTSAENVGSIVRSSAAFGVNSIIVDEKTCSPYIRRCIRVSMGNIFSMRTYHSQNIRTDLILLKKNGYEIISTANISQATSLKKFSFAKKSVIIIGSEGNGIDQDIIEMSNHVVKIDINPDVAHLNAANAATIFLSTMSSY